MNRPYFALRVCGTTNGRSGSSPGTTDIQRFHHLSLVVEAWGSHQFLFPGEYLRPSFNHGGRTHPRSCANFLGGILVSLSLPQSIQGQCCISQLIVLLDLPDAAVDYLLRGGLHLPTLSRAAPAQYRSRCMASDSPFIECLGKPSSPCHIADTTWMIFKIVAQDSYTKIFRVAGG